MGKFRRDPLAVPSKSEQGQVRQRFYKQSGGMGSAVKKYEESLNADVPETRFKNLLQIG